MISTTTSDFKGSSGIWTRDLSHSKRESYPKTNEPHDINQTNEYILNIFCFV